MGLAGASSGGGGDIYLRRRGVYFAQISHCPRRTTRPRSGGTGKSAVFLFGMRFRSDHDLSPSGGSARRSEALSRRHGSGRLRLIPRLGISLGQMTTVVFISAQPSREPKADDYEPQTKK